MSAAEDRNLAEAKAYLAVVRQRDELLEALIMVLPYAETRLSAIEKEDKALGLSDGHLVEAKAHIEQARAVVASTPVASALVKP